jgi:Arc/MetJ-type ribon-helix-helix transcriptional regulator
MLLEDDAMSKRTVWHLEVPDHLDEELEKYVENSSFKTKSEFIRAAVRDRLHKERNTN